MTVIVLCVCFLFLFFFRVIVYHLRAGERVGKGRDWERELAVHSSTINRSLLTV